MPTLKSRRSGVDLRTVVGPLTTDPDGGAAIAEEAYGIYRGMCVGSNPPARWDTLPPRTQAAFVFVARMALAKAR